MDTLEKYTKGQNLFATVIDILNKEYNSDVRNSLLEKEITFIEEGNFLEDISFTSKGAIKTISFFKEKSELIKLLEKLPKEFKERVWRILFNKLREMLPKEKHAFRYPCPGAWNCEHDRTVVRNLQRKIKTDLLETKDFLVSSIKIQCFSEEEINELLALIPDNAYLNYDATENMYPWL